jgi:hypothetical protein
MWEPLARARRRLLGDEPPPRTAQDLAIDDPSTDLTFALGRAELERLIGALADLPGLDPGRPDTPARLEAALHLAIVRAAGRGLPAVTRRPAGVYTPETWQIHVAGADRRARATLEQAMRGGGID